jgi:RHS repeat-associated protein
MDGFIPEDGETFSVISRIFYSTTDNGQSEDHGPKPVQVRLGWVCNRSDSGYEAPQHTIWSEPKTVVAPAYRWVGEVPGTEVTFSFTFDERKCIEYLKRNEDKLNPDWNSGPMWVGVTIGWQEFDGTWAGSSGWQYGSGRTVHGIALSALPDEQTYAPGCERSSARANQCQNHQGVGVNTATGAFSQSATDASLAGPLPVDLKRSYSSNNPNVSSFGKGWTPSWGVRLEVKESGDISLRSEDGSIYPFKKALDGTYEPPMTVNSTVKATVDGYELTTNAGEILQFSAAGQLLRQRSAQGHETTYEYTSGILASLKTSGGIRANFTYSGERLTEISLSDGRKITYEYIADRLSSVTAPGGKRVTYEYDGSGRLTSIVDPRGNPVVRNFYDSYGRVAEQVSTPLGKAKFSYNNGETDVTMADGGVWTDVYHKNVLLAQYDPFGNKASSEYTFRLDPVAVTDALGNRIVSSIDDLGRLRRIEGPLTRQTWNFSSGNLSSHYDGNGNASLYSYDAAHRLKLAKDSLGGITRYTYTATGRLETVTDPRGGVTAYGYDAAGNQNLVTYPDGSRQTQTHDASGRVISVVDPRGNAAGVNPDEFTTRYTYDDAGLPSTTTDAKGRTTKNTYDDSGNLTSTTDASGKITKYEYDAANRLVKTTDPAGNTVLSTYDVMGRLTSTTDQVGARTTYTYDKAGRMLTMTTPRGNLSGADASKYTWKYGYDKVGNQTSVTDPFGNTTATEYDAEYRPITVTDALGNVRKTKYDGEGHVLQATDALGKTTTNTYDANGRLATATDRDGRTVTYTYDPSGNLTSETSPLGFKTTYSYNSNGRRTGVTEPRGNIAGADPAQYTWTTGYDAAGNVTSQTDTLGNKTISSFDELGNLVEQVNPRGKKTTYSYNSLNQLATVTAPGQGTTTVTYDDLGRMTSRTNAKNYVTGYAYDNAGRLTKVTDALGRPTQFAYDVEGNRIKVTNGRGQTHTSTFDARDLLTSTLYSDGTPTLSYTYDAVGQVKTVADGTGTRTFTYDAEGRPLTISSPGATNPFKYTYNPGGTIKSRIYPDGRGITYTHDADGRTTGQTSGSETITYGWDAAGNLTSTNLPTTTARTETRTYDPAGRLASVSEGTGARHYTRDAVGLITADSFKDAFTTSLPTRYAYDDAGRLIRDCTDAIVTSSCLGGTAGSTYTYDTVGNLTTSVTAGSTTTNTYDAADQLTQATVGTTVTNLAYDADGNLTKDADGNYAYDAIGRVKSATVGTDTVTFTYDADGNRTVAKKNNTSIRISRWDVNNPLPQIATETSEVNGRGVLIGDYQYSPSGAPVAAYGPSGTFFFQHDRQDSVTAVHDAAGVEQYKYTYNAWGVSTGKASVTGAKGSVFGYTGQYKDPYLPGRLHLRARSYDPDTGRFTAPDPVPTTPGNPNASSYAYANNDPVNQSDPSGLCPLCISAGVGALIGGALEGGIYSWQHRNDGQFSWGGLATAAGKGALVGGAAGLLMPGAGNAVARGLGLSGGRALAASTAVNAGVGAGFSWGVNHVQCRPTDPWDLLFGAVGGASSSLVGPAFSWIADRFRSGAQTPGRYGPGAAHADDPALKGAGGFNINAIPEEPGFNYLYRGISVMHPGYDDAVRGVAKPRGGSASMETHHSGNTESIYTSWDTNRNTALRYARGAAEGRNDLPGVILQVKLPLGQPIYPSMMFSSELWEGTESLVEGLVRGAKVWHVPAP